MWESSLELKNLASTLRKRDPEENFNELTSLVTTVIGGKRADSIVKMMQELALDEPDNTRLGRGQMFGFINAPAAKRNHHAYRGGLVIHLLEMWTIWTHRFREDFDQTTAVNDKRILEGIIFHDLHKAYRTFRSVEFQPHVSLPWGAEYVKGDPDNESLTWETKTLWLLQWHEIALDNQQYNALLWSEGGWSPMNREKRQPWTSVLAKVLYLMDEYSGNVLSRMQDNTWRDVSEART